MWDPQTGLYTPTLEDLKILSKEKYRHHVNWSVEDDIELDGTIYELWTELITNLDAWDSGDEVFDDDVEYSTLDDQEADEYEAFDDFTIGVDNILNFDFDDESVYHNFHHIFYYFILYFLIINGFFILSCIYLWLGENMHRGEFVDDAEHAEAERALLVQEYAVKVYNAGPGIKDIEDEELEEDERTELALQIFYNSYDIEFYDLKDMKMENMVEYSKFMKNYFDLIILKNKKKSNNLKIDYLIKNFKKDFKISIKKEDKFKNAKFNLSEFEYNKINENIVLASNINVLDNKIKIYYLSL